MFSLIIINTNFVHGKMIYFDVLEECNVYLRKIVSQKLWMIFN